MIYQEAEELIEESCRFGLRIKNRLFYRAELIRKNECHAISKADSIMFTHN